MVSGPGAYDFEGATLRVERFPRTARFALKQPSGVLVFDAGALAFPLRIRHWREGDWMRPLGMRGSKKLSDLFVDLKYSLVDKARALVMEIDGDGVLPGSVGAHMGDSEAGRPVGAHMGESEAGRSVGAHVGALLGERIDDSLKVGPATLEIVRITVVPSR